MKISIAKLLKLFRKDLTNNGKYMLDTLEKLRDNLDSMAYARENGMTIYQSYDDICANVTENAEDCMAVLDNVLNVYKKLLKIEQDFIKSVKEAK